MVETQTLEQLVRDSSRGDAEAFRRLYETLVQRIFAYIASRTDRSTATDLTQDTFVELYKALPKFNYRSEPEFHSFVYLIAKRLLAKHYGNRHTKAEQVRDELDESVLSDNMGDESTRVLIEQALLTLDEVTRDIVALHHWSRYTFPEIAIIVGMKESAVRTRHHRALANLKEQFRNATSI